MNIPIPYKNLSKFFLAVFLIVAVTACGDDDDDPVSPTPEPEEPEDNIVEVAQSDDRFSTLVSALADAGLVSTLEGDGPFTVFAPTDSAFGNLPEGLLDTLSTEQLSELLTYHVIGANVLSTDLEEQQTVASLTEEDLFITATDGEVNVNDRALVITADIEASNGTIHAVDNVLLPDAYQDVTGIVIKRYSLQTLQDALTDADLVTALQAETENGYTVFAPDNEAFEGVDLSGLSIEELQNILTYHVLPAAVLSTDLDSTQTVEALNGDSLHIATDGEIVTITDGTGESVEVTTANLEGTNGVVHIIDGVLLPE
jgi:transforming growth factor-beta-induced protein